MSELPVVVRHQTGTVTIEGEDLVIRLTSPGGMLHKPRPEEVRVPLERASLKIDGADLSIYRDGKIERMVLGCEPPDQLARLAELIPAHEPQPEQSTPEVRVKTYHDAKEYERDAPVMAAAGWMPQGQTASRGKINVGRTVAKGAVLLPWALLRPSRQGDPVTVTWVRPG